MHALKHVLLIAAAAMVLMAAPAVSLAATVATTPLYQVIPSGQLKRGETLTATITVPATVQADPNVIGVTVPSSDWPDRFVAAYTHADGSYIAVWVGKRGSGWSENWEAWKATTSAGSTHKVLIKFLSNGEVVFYVDGKEAYSFTTPLKVLTIIHYGAVTYHVGSGLTVSKRWVAWGVLGAGVIAVLAAAVAAGRGVEHAGRGGA